MELLDHNYRVGYFVILVNNQQFKYETPCKVPCTTTQTWTNGMVISRMGGIMDIFNIQRLE